MNGMFWLAGAVKREPAIDVWLNEQPPELGAIARTCSFGCANAARMSES